MQKSIHSFILVWAIISTFSIVCCRGVAIDRNVIVAIASASNATEGNQCGFLGNSDVLGIGIRLGYYTQALSVWFANYYVPSEAKVLRSINLLFLVAIFIGVIWLAHRTEQSYAIEVYLLLRLLFATWFIGVIDRSRFSKKRWGKNHARVIVRECSYLGLVAYMVWLAWRGLDVLKETPCGTFVFFAAKLDLYGRFRSFLKVMVVFVLCTICMKEVDTILSLCQRWWSTSIPEPTYYARLEQSLNNSVIQNTAQEPVELKILKVAMQTPLPESPTTTSVPSEIASPATTNPDDNSSAVDTNKFQDLPSLDDLILVENYLNSIINIDVQDHSRWCYEIPRIRLTIFLPSIHSPATLSRRVASLFACRPIRLSILIPLFRHIKSLFQYPTYSYGFMIEAASHSPLHKQIATKALIPALAMHKTQLPDHRHTPSVVFHAAVSLLTCIELILNIELSIHWNGITGMSNLGATGQLIPATIGIGGLARVIWVWWSGVGNDDMDEAGVDKKLKNCAETYLRLKKKKEDRDRNQVVGMGAP